MLVQAQLAVQKGLKEGGRRHLRPSPTDFARLTEVCSPRFCVSELPTVLRHQPAALGVQAALPPSLVGTRLRASTCGSPGRVSGLPLEQTLPWLSPGPVGDRVPIVDAGPFLTLLVGGWWEQPHELPAVILCI